MRHGHGVSWALPFEVWVIYTLEHDPSPGESDNEEFRTPVRLVRHAGTRSPMHNDAGGRKDKIMDGMTRVRFVQPRGASHRRIMLRTQD